MTTPPKAIAQPEALAVDREPEAPVEKIVITGGRPLNGVVPIAGAKNAALPIMAAMLLAGGRSRLTRVPDLRDVHSMKSLLELLGARVAFADGELDIDATHLTGHEAPYKVVSKMRASFYVLGPLLARLGRARVSLPGGCAWGPRPVNLHIQGLQALGAEIDVEHGYVVAHASRLRGAEFHFDISSVGATAHVMMAACLAEGTSVLTNVAREPEVVALAECLQAMGARIEGAGTTTLVVHGVEALHPVAFENIPDRIEAGTYLIAGAMGGGQILVENVRPDHLGALVDKLREMGISVSEGPDAVAVRRTGRVRAVDVTTEVFPGFPTDLQAQMMAALTLADGVSRITDTIYHDRFAHVPELRRLGADIELEGNIALVTGIDSLEGTYVRSGDLRASASLILAGLVATGETHVTHVHHLDRGYELLEDKLRTIGAQVRREEDPNGDE